MKKKSGWSALTYLAYFGQFGINMIVPPVLFTWIAWYLKNRFGWGDGVVIAGILIGIGAAGMNLYKFMLFMQKKAEESQREDKR